MTKSILTSLLVFGIFVCVHGQNAKSKELDSLLQIIDELPENKERTKILRRLHELVMFKDPLKGRYYAEQGLELSIRLGDEKGIAAGNMQIANYFVNRNEIDSATHYFDIALTIFDEIDYKKGQIFVNHSLADIERQQGNYGKARMYVNRNIFLYENRDKENDDIGKFNLIGAEYELLGAIFMEKGNYNLALQSTLKAARFFNDLKDKVREADALNQIGKIEFALENFQSSLDYSLKAYEIYKEYDDKVYQGYAANSIGVAFFELGNTANALDYLQKAIDLSRATGVKSALAASLKDLGRVYFSKGNISKAKNAFEESQKISSESKIVLENATVLFEMTTIDVEEEKYSLALEKLNKIINLVESIEANSLLSDTYKKRAEVYQLIKQPDLAVNDFKLHLKLKDTIFSLKKSQQIEELKTIYETEKKEAEIALQEEEINTLNEKSRADKLKKGLYAGGMASALALFGLSVFGFRQRIKKNRIAREKQEEIYKQEIAHKKKELTSQTLHLVQKNTFIQELMDNLENIKNSPEKFKMEYRRIVMLLKKENASDKDWEVFKTYFADVHNDFDQKLKTLYAEISEKEIRLAAFLRMNLTTKEIAATLNVLPDSILKSKYRLKKKLNLDKDIDLTSFLNTL